MPFLKPFLERGLAFLRAVTGKKVVHADVLIQFWPVDALAAGDEFVILAFVFGSGKDPGIPGQRDGNMASVIQVDSERVLAERDPDGEAFMFKSQSIHAISLRPRIGRERATVRPRRLSKRKICKAQRSGASA